ncbi:S41 family peptidase [Gilvimarinus sp. SDUM040013]|uniref:S41 family peptidase n=1 Tax=Gilvimarinus gilvus TaxID=3058038 RepID=A0ABU4RZT5_9GAMM|nr:S41 family peptidase [Gilvimarinus sp. SDUM040013]MDO3386087.1 S41 family peptidase [Gilvimarinus sp. SDUM040013]MDX6850372.1 S41 family peptidase [Gilvimarinus sp. SDUM040013]
MLNRQQKIFPINTVVLIPLFIIFCFIFTIPNAFAKTPQQDVAKLPMSETQVRQSLTQTLKTFQQVYVFPDKAKQVSDTMLMNLEKGKYKGIKTRKEFAETFTQELKILTTDRHLSVNLVEDTSKTPTHIGTHEEDYLKNNFALERLEILKGNVGYIKLNKFYSDEEARPVVDAAFTFLERSDAIIIDLRECIGGSPELVRYIVSFFVEEDIHLWSIIDKHGTETYQAKSSKTEGRPVLKKDTPLYILTSSGTASAAEVFTYTLKHLKRATVVGEKTFGIAYLVGSERINDMFDGRFSMVRPYNPITKSDWELKGVLPHYSVTAQESLGKTLTLISEQQKNN